MTINHHPNDELLLDYASGALGEAWGIAIATHLALCPDCRRIVRDMEALGGSFVESETPAAVDTGAFDQLMARLDAADAVAAGPGSPSTLEANGAVLPQPLRGYLGGDVDRVNWRRLGRGAFQVIIPTGQEGVTARLLRIPAGRPVPEHSHGGLELTLVLCGAFADATGTYVRGDLQEADENLEHQPHATAGEDCICLAVTDAPLQFSSFAARLVQPLLKI